MKTFNIATDTTPIADFQFGSAQQMARSAEEGCVRVFRFRYLNGPISLLPKYVQKAIAGDGLVAVYLGGTTYSHIVVGLKEVK